MIKKISRINNLGIFDDYHWGSSLPEFQRFNLIYGWNGSGKTTISQLFASFNVGKSETYPDLEYKIQTTDGEFSNNISYNKQIRVFNRDYVDDNINISSGTAKPIFILGKENKELAEAIKVDEKVLFGDPAKKGDLGKIKELDIKKKELDRKEAEKGKQFSDVAKIISTNTSGVSARNYRKNNAEQAFSKLKTKRILSEEEISLHSTTLKQQERPTLDELIISDIEKTASEILLSATPLMQRTVETVIITRLKENPNISKWVENGLKLHSEIKSAICEFCNQPLPQKRLSELLAYFNDADKKLKEDIDILVGKTDLLYTAIENINAVDKANLYDELQKDYSLKVEEFKKQKIELLNSIAEFKEEILQKKINTTISLELKSNVTTQTFTTAAKMLNAEISKHNNKTNNFTQAKEAATANLENHYLSEIYDDVVKLEEDINKLKEEVHLFEDGDPQTPSRIGIAAIQQRITDNKNKIATSGPACEEINKQLKTFLGRDELIFEVAAEGYLIKRKSKIAKNLSEGEKTAIAFVYFTIHLHDQNYKTNEGIVVVDDPVCSMDSNSIYQAFAFLKNAVKDSAQVFILTHNFDFLRLLLNWLYHYPKSEGKKEYYMVKNQFSIGTRIATLDSLDNLLKEHESEYHYMFKILHTFQSDGTIESVYHIPNIARKVLEYFLLLMVPNCETMYKKLERIKFDENKKAAIYKFTNDQSHITGKGFDPSLVPECQNNVKHLLEMINEVFPQHYKVLVESIGTIKQS